MRLNKDEISIQELSDEKKIVLKNSLNIINKLDYENHEIFLHVESEIEYNTRTISCRKEPEIVDWIHSTFSINDETVFYDIGANIGAYSLVASKFAEGNIKIYAFEPSFVNYYQLNKNIILNNSQNSIIPMNLALSSNNSLDKFNYSTLASGAAAHAFGEPIDETGEIFQPENISMMHCYKLDDLIKNFGLLSPTHLKIDVDGIEWHVLVGAKETLKSRQLKHLVVEIIYEEEANKFIEFLNKFGFKFISRHAYTGISPGFNYIFKKK